MRDSAPWTTKYHPKCQAELVGQQDASRRVKAFVESYSKSRKKALLIYGPVGCGKTSSIYAIAKDLNLEVLEVNASDFRTEKEITSKVGAASQQRSLFSTGKIILVDELDGIAGREDRGGIAALSKLLESSAYPIIITANDPWHKKFNSLRRACEIIEYKALDRVQAEEILRKVCNTEKIVFEEDALKALALRSGGDLRGAITDLQLLACDGTLTKHHLDSLDPRNREESITTALTKIFKGTDEKVALAAFDNVSEDIQECMLWLEENIPWEYSNPSDLGRAYDMLSLADLYYGRIRRWQHWRFLVYVNAFASLGISAAKEKKYSGIASYRRSSRILKIFIANMKYRKRLSIAQKVASSLHSSTRKEVQQIPYLKSIFKNKEAAKAITEDLELSSEESDWLSH
jgi:replication factor C large subunit